MHCRNPATTRWRRQDFAARGPTRHELVDVLLKLELAGPEGLRAERMERRQCRGARTRPAPRPHAPAGVRPAATRRCSDRASGTTPRSGSRHDSRRRRRRAGRRASPPPRTAATGHGPVPAHRSWRPNPVCRRARARGRTTRHASTPPASHSARAAAISLTQQTSAMPMRSSVSTNARSSPATRTTRADLKRTGKPRLNATTITKVSASSIIGTNAAPMLVRRVVCRARSRFVINLVSARAAKRVASAHAKALSLAANFDEVMQRCNAFRLRTSGALVLPISARQYMVNLPRAWGW